MTFDCHNHGNDLWLLLEKNGDFGRRRNLLFAVDIMSIYQYSFLKSTKEVFNVQGPWHSLNMCYMYWWQFPGLNCQKCLLRPQVTERRCPLNGGCQVTLLWTIMGNMFRECHGPCTLKTSFVDFRKEYWYMLIISTAKSKFLRLPKSPF
jgi:hypothetical protein